MIASPFGRVIARWIGASIVAFGPWLSACAATPKAVLVVSVTQGFRHASIPTAEKTLSELAAQSGKFSVQFARVDPGEARFQGIDKKPDQARVDSAIKLELAEKMSAQALKGYDGVIFANTTGELPLPDKQAFVDWLATGKAFVGMHSATDTFHEFTPYLQMIGAEFAMHGAQKEVEVVNRAPECPACSHLPARWKVFDELYVFTRHNPLRVRELLQLDQHPFEEVAGSFPVSWHKRYGKGRVFYTSLGHREDLWDPETPVSYQRKNSKETAQAFREHILHGILWALQLEEWNAEAQPSPGH